MMNLMHLKIKPDDGSHATSEKVASFWGMNSKDRKQICTKHTKGSLVLHLH